jgi:hypothetical protein
MSNLRQPKKQRTSKLAGKENTGLLPIPSAPTKGPLKMCSFLESLMPESLLGLHIMNSEVTGKQNVLCEWQETHFYSLKSRNSCSS